VPLVLLHGGGDTIGTSFGKLLPALARERQVIAFEQQGFGHTADVADRPFTFEQSADDTVALLDHLHIAQADLLGFSNGGTIALQVAIRHPARVRRLVPISTFFSRAGGEAWFWDSFDQVTLEVMPKELRDAYVAVAPHPENLQSFFDKCVARMKAFKDIPEEQVRGIRAPALVICGDKDVVRPEHAVALFRLLPHGQIAIIPAADHMSLTSRVELLGPMIMEFLGADFDPAARTK
jgi:pimeloyl-ACP methyl ester carboxylesterase